MSTRRLTETLAGIAVTVVTLASLALLAFVLLIVQAVAELVKCIAILGGKLPAEREPSSEASEVL